MGEAYAALGELQKSISYLHRALSDSESAYGPNHLFAGQIHKGLGTVYPLMQQPEQALYHFRRHLYIYTDFYGNTHPEIALSWYYMGEIYMSLSQLDQAEHHFQRGLQVAEKCFENTNEFFLCFQVGYIFCEYLAKKPLSLGIVNELSKKMTLLKDEYQDTGTVAMILLAILKLVVIYEENKNIEQAIGVMKYALKIGHILPRGKSLDLHDLYDFFSLRLSVLELNLEFKNNRPFMDLPSFISMDIQSILEWMSNNWMILIKKVPSIIAILRNLVKTHSNAAKLLQQFIKLKNIAKRCYRELKTEGINETNIHVLLPKHMEPTVFCLEVMDSVQKFFSVFVMSSFSFRQSTPVDKEEKYSTANPSPGFRYTTHENTLKDFINKINSQEKVELKSPEQVIRFLIVRKKNALDWIKKLWHLAERR